MYWFSLQGYKGAAAPAALSRGFTSGLSTSIWAGCPDNSPDDSPDDSPDEDEVDAYDHITVFTDEYMEMDLDDLDYYTRWRTPETLMTPPPEPATLPYYDTGTLSWQDWPMTTSAVYPPSPASTGSSVGGTPPWHRLRRRARGRIESTAHTKPPPGGLGRVLDQKRARIDRRRPQPGSAAQRQRRLRTLRESHINKSSPPRHQLKLWGRKLALCLPRIEGVLTGGWWRVTCRAAAISATNSEQVAEEDKMDWVSEDDEMDWVSEKEEMKAARRGGSQAVDSFAGSEPVYEAYQAEYAPPPADMPMEMETNPNSLLGMPDGPAILSPMDDRDDEDYEFEPVPIPVPAALPTHRSSGRGRSARPLALLSTIAEEDEDYEPAPASAAEPAEQLPVAAAAAAAPEGADLDLARLNWEAWHEAQDDDDLELLEPAREAAPEDV